VDLSVVLPTLHKVGTGQLLAQRIGEICGSDLSVEVIIVTPKLTDVVREPNVKLVVDEGGGVYAAYARGLREASGEYVWLMGDDDFPLDSLARLAPLIKSRRADLIVAPVIYSTGKVYRATQSAFLLLFFNWCQQGVLYRARVLAPMKFYRRLRIQADHYVNVLLRSDRSLHIAYVDDPLCVFGAHGISSRGGDQRFRSLRPQLARRTLSLPGFLVFQTMTCIADALKWLRGRR
jgi:glycosyltransferase involved in cell wall biosynthesis